MPIPLIIDCDPGVDDAVMLLLALASPELDVRAITTVGGNAPGALTARNATVVRALAGRPDVPVFAGCAGPMLRAPVHAGRFHGESGLGPLAIDDIGEIDGTHAVDAIVEMAMAVPPKSLTIAVTGPMTNIAMALLREPRLAASVARIVAMGGARSAGGNITPSAEFNIFADPHAAQIVMASGCEVVMFGLDATYQVRATASRIATIAAIDTPRARAVADLLRFSDAIQREIGPDVGPPLHDPCPIAWLIAPRLFVTRACGIAVETASPLTLGHTAVELRQPGHHHWATEADGDGVFALLAERLA